MKITLRVLLVSNFLNTLAYSLFFPLYAIYIQKIDSSVLAVSSTMGWYTFITGVTILAAGKLEDVVKKKEQIVALGYFILVAGSLGYLFVNSIWMLYLIQTINAIGIGIVVPAWKAMYSCKEDKGMEAKEWSFFDGGNMLLAGLATVTGGLIVRLSGFEMLIILMAGLQLCSAISSLKLLKK